MRTNTSTVGGLALPVPAGPLDADFADPALLGIAGFLRFMLKDALDAELATLRATSADALPEGNVYPFDPASHFVREQFPALYLWWTGRSTRQPWTLYYDLRLRRLGAQYIFAEVVAPGSLIGRHGLVAAADAAFFRAAEHGYHPAYGYGGDPLGTPLFKTLGIKGWTYDGGEPGFLTAIPTTATREGLGPNDGAITRGYLALQGWFTVYERVTRMGVPVPGVDVDTATHPLRVGEYTTEEASLEDAVLIRGDG